MNVKIVKGRAPIVGRVRRGKYPWNSLPIGDHFVVKNIDANAPSIRSCATRAGLKFGKRFSVHEQPNGDVTVERME